MKVAFMNGLKDEVTIVSSGDLLTLMEMTQKVEKRYHLLGR